MRHIKKRVRDASLEASREVSGDINYVIFTRQYRRALVRYQKNRLVWNYTWLELHNPHEEKIKEIAKKVMASDDQVVLINPDIDYLNTVCSWRAACKCKNLLVMYKRPERDQECSCGEIVKMESFERGGKIEE